MEPGMRRYDSFVIRCWGLGGAEPRIKIEHVQSGAAARVASLAEALAWLDAHARAAQLPHPLGGDAELPTPDSSAGGDR
jgi:hypothetical protein